MTKRIVALASIACLATLCVVVGCSSRAGSGPDTAPPDTPLGTAAAGTEPRDRTLNETLLPVNVEIRDRFTHIADRIQLSENKYLGQHQPDRFRRELQRGNLDIQTEVNLWLQLCFHELRLGNIEDADKAIQSAFAIVEKSGRKPPPPMQKLKALVYLREAEYRNCVQRHNCECCVFPLKGGGIHAIKEPMTKAKESLLELLQQTPRNLEAGWLLNITGMALGGYPNSIPETYRLPSSVFESKHAAPKFNDIAPKLGVDTFNLCGGAMVEDFDGDNLLDIVTSTYDLRQPMTFYRNVGDGTFANHSVASQLASQLSGLNCIAADYDNDGDSDILVLRGAWLYDDGQLRNSLLRNNGDGTFSDVTSDAGLADPGRPTQAAVWGDFDNDGWLDIFVGNESRVEMQGEHQGGDYPSQLFHNQGDGTFVDVAISAGVTNDRYCKGVTAGDYDNDGDLDIYVSNSNANRLYRNDGAMKFTDVASQLGVNEPEQWSFACWFFDYNDDGWLDLFVAAYQSTVADVAADYIGIPNKGVAPCLYRNRGDGTFENVASEVNLDHAYMPMGANFGDIDNDGCLDIYLTTGSPDFASLTPNVMLRNDNGKEFQDVTFSAGVGHLQKGHGIAFADLDNDGDQDIYHQLGGFFPGDKFHNTLFLNSCAGSATEFGRNHFITLKLVGTHCNRQAVGARVRVVTTTPSGTQTRHRAVGMVSSFGGSPSRQEIGLGNATSIDRIEIDWPNDPTTQTVRNVGLDSFVEVTQGKAEARKLDLPKLNWSP